MEKKNYKKPGIMREIEANELLYILETGIEPKLYSDRTNITGDIEEIDNESDYEPKSRYKKPKNRYKREDRNGKK